MIKGDEKYSLFRMLIHHNIDKATVFNYALRPTAHVNGPANLA